MSRTQELTENRPQIKTRCRTQGSIRYCQASISARSFFASILALQKEIHVHPTRSRSGNKAFRNKIDREAFASQRAGQQSLHHHRPRRFVVAEQFKIQGRAVVRSKTKTTCPTTLILVTCGRTAVPDARQQQDRHRLYYLHFLRKVLRARFSANDCIFTNAVHQDAEREAQSNHLSQQA